MSKEIEEIIAEDRKEVAKLLEGASLERLAAIKVMTQISDEDAVLVREALSLAESGYNLTKINAAIQALDRDEGPKIIRSRTIIRVFAFLEDEDDPDSAKTYRGFYVTTATAEQVIAIEQDSVAKTKFLAKKGIKFNKLTPEDIKSGKTPEIDMSFLESKEFEDMVANPSQEYRNIVTTNIREVVLDGDTVIKPLSDVPGGFKLPPEAIMQRLEKDLMDLMREQAVDSGN